MVRTRFAPSPTGLLHLGGARTALFNYIFARQNKGKFLFRIEDTDQKRCDPSHLLNIQESLHWLGITWDDEPIQQSLRQCIYDSAVAELLFTGKAYAMNGMVFMACPKESITFHDLIRGKVTISGSQMGDFFLQRSDGTAGYNLACALDDADSQITHVIRGEDHIANTANQIHMLKALGLSIPTYAHLPLIVDKHRQKLSKRAEEAPTILGLRDEGYVAPAVVNALARMGWGKGNQEIFTINDLIASFDLTRVSKGPAQFDKKKLDWLNKEHTKKLIHVV